MIRAELLNELLRALNQKQPDAHLLTSPFIQDNLISAFSSVTNAISAGVPTTAMSGALNYLDSISSARLPTNLVQDQRGYFGAHTYERTDQDGIFHTEWQRKSN